MKKIFLDYDVVLDLLLDREPFMDDIAEIIENSLVTGIRLCLSPISVTNINYIIGRIESQKKADSQTKKILKIVRVENVGQSTINKASNSKFKDFEDGVQNFCAEESGHRIIVTRNTKDYKESELSILTPKEYLAKLNNE
ncbi:MAG: PIN domain-containing protein [Bacteroidetes bacterium]|nr:PIN domain-containing protein [Bacteroidota bacterium]